jgi:dynein heavy chain, axonemal
MQVLEDGKTTKKERWVREGQGQLLITASQIMFTAECEKALLEDEAAKSALRSLRKKWLLYLERLTALLASPLSAIDRKKVCPLRGRHTST